MIKTQNLSKSFDGIQAVDDLTFSVEPGEVLGFLGPNGAGKSTTMRMLAGFITPTGGSASICGHDVTQDAIAARSVLGYLPEGAPHYGEMTVGGFLNFVANLRGLADAQRKTRLDYVIGRLQLEGVIAQTIETLSKGFKRRVGLAQAIVHDPKVLILDEPTDGLDPLQKHEVRTLIGEIAKEKTIVISTHILEEVDAVCTRALIIARGKLVADDTPAALKARAPSGRLDDVFRAVAA
jgi:ABC-2 type transport system ATP-binding protein